MTASEKEKAFVSKEISSTLMAANLFSTLLVITIHYNTLASIDTSSGYGWNYLFQQFLANGVAKSAVPVFALLFGYFIFIRFGRNDGYIAMLIDKSRTLLLPYLLASTLIFTLASAAQQAFGTQKPDLCLYSILYGIIAHPLSVQFWYLRDIIVLTLISPLIVKLEYPVFYIVGVASFFLWLFNIQPFPIAAQWHLINSEVLFFFWLGVFLRKKRTIGDKFFSERPIKPYLVLIWFALIVIRISIDPDLDVWYTDNYTPLSIVIYKVAIALGVLSIIQFSSLMRNSRLLIYLSGLTFFVYLFHLVPMSYFRYVTRHIISTPYSYYLNLPIAVIMVFCAALFLSRQFPALYRLITGGRTPQKATGRID